MLSLLLLMLSIVIVIVIAIYFSIVIDVFICQGGVNSVTVTVASSNKLIIELPFVYIKDVMQV